MSRSDRDRGWPGRHAGLFALLFFSIVGAVAPTDALAGYKAAVDDVTKLDASGQFCATVSAVHVVISIQPRVIHLARELSTLPRCLLKAVLDHERQHARADDQALDEWMPDVSHRVRDAIAQLPALQATTEEDAKALVVAAIRTQLQELVDELQLYRDRLNQIVDSPDAIMQLRHTC